MNRLLVCLALILPSLVLADAIRLSEPVASDAHSETFGAVPDASLPRLSLAELMADADAHVGEARLIETRVGQVCQKKGCFFMAIDGDLALRVSFRNYGFFVPTDTGGKTVMLAGELVSRERSAAWGVDHGQIVIRRLPS